MGDMRSRFRLTALILAIQPLNGTNVCDGTSRSRQGPPSGLQACINLTFASPVSHNLTGVDFDDIDCHPLLKRGKGFVRGRPGTVLNGTAIFDVRSRHIGTTDGDKLSSQLKAAPAFSFPQSKVRIFCKDLPWEIIVENSAGNITVGDVLRTIHVELQKGLTTGEWFIAPDKDRTRMSKAFRTAINTEGSGRELSNGVKRVDYLGSKTRFEELKLAQRKEHDWAFSRLGIFGPAAGTDNVWILNLGDSDEE